MSIIAIGCYGIILVCWGLVGFVICLDVSDDIDGMPWYKKAITYVVVGPLVWAFIVYIYIIGKYIIDPFMEWLKGDNHG